MNPTSVDTIDADARSFRVRTLRILGGTQIALGIVCAILSLVGVAFDGVRMNKNCPHNSNSYYYYMYHYGTDSYYYGYTDCTYYLNASTLFGFNITCLIFSGWRAENESGGLAALPSFLAVFAILEMVVAIIASSYCCCCTSWGSSNQLRYVYVANGQNGMILNMPLSQLNTGQLQRFAVPTQLTHVPSGITPQSQNLQNMQTFHAQLGHASDSEATPPVYPSSASITTTQQEDQSLGNCSLPPPYKE
ncbi:unnamed protein product [Mytilus coruscus]|uniref:Uncharacterized protein n=1 Tax=Mytilus coruscus TaxID=42192 RepID=A0A6J8BCL5_MYTCO|nr:unnamed protein product [Mytilus coruscus]